MTTAMALDSLDLARWQFGITTVYHFILVPLTIGLAPLVALMETAWLKTGNEQWLTLTKFFGKVFIINFALGVATGIVQEFQFGMNWSEYSRFVGNIFGAPLAFEALLAFFMESTFMGVWIFGWDRLSKKLHNLCIWMVALGVNLSALFILAANSWMQHPVGAVVNPKTGRAELDGIGGFIEVLTSPLTWATYLHVVTTALLVAGAMVMGISIWWMVRAARAEQKFEATELWRRGARFGAYFALIAGIGVLGTGHWQGQQIAEYQPAKFAAAEALCQSQEGAGFTVAAFGDCSANGGPTRIIEIPKVYSFMATNDFNARMTGLDEAQKDMEQRFGSTAADGSKINYTPDVMTTFWTFRLMIGTGSLSILLALVVLYLTRANKLIANRKLGTLALWSVTLPFLGASFGWIFTEIGRQPWVVAPNLATVRPDDPTTWVYMLTQNGVSTVVSSASVLTSMVVFTLLYAALGVVWFMLLRRYVREGVRTPVADKPADDAELTFQY